MELGTIAGERLIHLVSDTGITRKLHVLER